MAKALLAARFTTEVAPPQVVPKTMPRRTAQMRRLDPIAEDDDWDEQLPYCKNLTCARRVRVRLGRTGARRPGGRWCQQEAVRASHHGRGLVWQTTSSSCGGGWRPTR
ncbi:uncharacterized protein C2845_PM11G15180 [Panicum miliaceum]|uniref:Uncharacterized protein n=1 Tax=Panicum miliaceum TaxID=4540 RepID=A0A3L6RUI7_PANMI|nr:uncharacterized protein C2845_PM11G15180 [Panicum miliaceum]